MVMPTSSAGMHSTLQAAVIKGQTGTGSIPVSKVDKEAAVDFAAALIAYAFGHPTD